MTVELWHLRDFCLLELQELHKIVLPMCHLKKWERLQHYIHCRTVYFKGFSDSIHFKDMYGVLSSHCDTNIITNHIIDQFITANRYTVYILIFSVESMNSN